MYATFSHMRCRSASTHLESPGGVLNLQCGKGGKSELGNGPTIASEDGKLNQRVPIHHMSPHFCLHCDANISASQYFKLPPICSAIASCEVAPLPSAH